MGVELLLMAGLSHSKCIHDSKGMGDLLNPIYQSQACMIAAGNFSKDQYQDSEDKLIDQIAHHYKRKTPVENTEPSYTNEWDQSRLLDGR